MQGQFGEPVEGWPETRWPLLGIYEKEPFSKEEIESHCLDYTDEDIKAHLKVLKGKKPHQDIQEKDAIEDLMLGGKASSVYEGVFEFHEKYGDVLEQNSPIDLVIGKEKPTLVRCGDGDHRLELLSVLKRK